MPKGQKIGIVLVAVLVGFVIGSAIREFTAFDVAGVGAAVGIPAIIALFGMFWIADNWKDALTASFAVTYFIFLAGILAIFVFPEQDFKLEGGAKVVVDNFTGLVAIVMTAYFGQEAVRAAAQAYSDGRFFGPGGAGNPGTGGGGGGGQADTRGGSDSNAAAPFADPRARIDTNATPASRPAVTR